MWHSDEIEILGENNGTSVSQIYRAFYDQNKSQKEWKLFQKPHDQQLQ